MLIALYKPVTLAPFNFSLALVNVQNNYPDGATTTGGIRTTGRKSEEGREGRRLEETEFSWENQIRLFSQRSYIKRNDVLPNVIPDVATAAVAATAATLIAIIRALPRWPGAPLIGCRTYT